MVLLAVSFWAGSNHKPPFLDFRRLVYVDIIMQFSTIAVFPLICFYIRSLYDETNLNVAAYLLYLPSILLTTAAVVVTILLGIDHSSDMVQVIYSKDVNLDNFEIVERAYVVLTYKIYRIVFFISIALSTIYVSFKLYIGKFKFVHVFYFLRGTKSSFVANILCLFFILYFVNWTVCVVFADTFMNALSIWSTLWCLFTAFLLFLMGYVSSIPPLPGGYMNLDRMRHPFSAMRQSRQEYLQSIDSGPVVGEQASGYDKIMDSFKNLMEVNQGFLNPALTIDEVATKLDTNRTYVSKLVNIYYGMPFRDYLNSLRMNHAKQLMIDEPDAVIDYVAAKSGFQSATQFIRKFREMEGVTPTVWKTSNRKK
jgi:AraC-like DNA-binding protein